ncbi:MAG: restriction endonuclease subunit S [Anaerolineales bacterium]|jgi:type I restriction enzyme S subunit
MKVVKLRHISSQIDYGLTTSATSQNTGNKFLRISDIHNGIVSWDNVPFCKCSISDVKKYELHWGDILFARTGSVGNSYMIQKPPKGSVFASYLIRIRPNQNLVFPPYLSYFFQTADYWNQIKKSSAGAINLGLNSTKLKELELPLPPLSEQERVASILEKADRLRHLRRFALEMSESYLHSVFIEMFGDPVCNPMGWDFITLGNYLDFITSGSRGWAKYYSKKGARFIRSLDVRMNHISDNEAVYVTPPVSAESKRTLVQDGDVLLTITGSRIGRVSSVPNNIGEAYVSQHVAIIRIKENLEPEFLAHFLSHPHGGQYQILKSQYGQTKPGLNLDQIKAFQILYPPNQERIKFIKVVNSYSQLVNQLKEAERQAEHLFQSLLHKAFRGEL